MSHLGPVLAASAVVLLTIPSAAFADIPTTASKSFVKTEVCQPGDTCTNSVQQNADGKLSGTLAVSSSEEATVPLGTGEMFQSQQGFAARFTDTFYVFSRTGEVTFEQSWRIEGVATAVSADYPTDSRGVGCVLRWGEKGEVIFFRGVAVPSTETFSTTLDVGPGKGKHRVTVFTELECSATDLGRSEAKLELTEASLDHMHVTGTPR